MKIPKAFETALQNKEELVLIASANPPSLQFQLGVSLGTGRLHVTRRILPCRQSIRAKWLPISPRR